MNGLEPITIFIPQSDEESIEDFDSYELENRRNIRRRTLALPGEVIAQKDDEPETKTDTEEGKNDSTVLEVDRQETI